MNSPALQNFRLACFVSAVAGLVTFVPGAWAAGQSEDATAPHMEVLAMDDLSMEVLAMSRGRGVPEATRAALQAIAATAESAMDSGSVISVRNQIVGLEGETRLCILFRDQSSLDEFSGEIRHLASGVDLLQIHIAGNSCPNKAISHPRREK